MTRITVSAVTIAVILDLKGCSWMSARDRNTVIGLCVGAFRGRRAPGTVGRAAVGDAIGNPRLVMIKSSGNNHAESTSG